MKITVLGVAIAAASFMAPSASAQGVLNVYCSVQVEWCTLLANEFQKTSGTKVSITQKGSGETIAQLKAEAFVQAVASATGRLPLVYVHPSWANSARITPDSILARCGLWVADYHDSPEMPLAWAASGWRLWQYAGDESTGRPAYGQTTIVQGVSHCDRNLFNGDADALHRFWGAAGAS